MNDAKQIDRRKFIRLSSAMLTTLPVLVINSGAAQELTELSETDPNAIALGYKTDAVSVEIEAYPSFDSTQACDNCLFYEALILTTSDHAKCFLIIQSVQLVGAPSIHLNKFNQLAP